MAYKPKSAGKGKTKDPSAEVTFTGWLRSSKEHAVVGDELASWTGCMWRILSPVEKSRLAAGWLERSDPSAATSSKVSSCLSIATSLLPELSLDGVGPIVAAKNTWLVPTPDGRFRMTTPDRSIGVTHACDLELTGDGSGFYEPKPVPADSSFGRFLETSLPDPQLRRAVQQFCGYTLLPTINVQTAHVWIGEGGNGKGLLKALLGRFHPKTAAINIRDLGGFGLGGIVGASLLTVDEGPKDLVDSQTLKSVISGDAIEIQRKFRDPVTYRPRGKVLICSNHDLRTNDHSEGFWRRQIIVPWEVALSEGERDHGLEGRIIASEMSIVFDWFLAGAADFLGSGCKLYVPSKSEERKRAAIVAANSCLSWIEDREVGCKRMPEGSYTRKSELFSDYVRWCLASNLKAFGMVEFWKIMHKKFPDLDECRRRFGDFRETCVNVSHGAKAPVAGSPEAAEDAAVKAELTAGKPREAVEVAQRTWNENGIAYERTEDHPFGGPDKGSLPMAPLGFIDDMLIPRQGRTACNDNETRRSDHGAN